MYCNITLGILHEESFMRLMLHYVLYLDPGTYSNRKEARLIGLATDKEIGNEYSLGKSPGFFPLVLYMYKKYSICTIP